MRIFSGYRIAAVTIVLGCSPTVTRFSTSTAPPLTIAPEFVVVAPGDHVTFAASGGSGGLHFAFGGGTAQSGGDASVDALSGAYVAGSGGSVTDTIVVSDASGKQATATVNVGAALTIGSTTTNVAPNQRLVIAAGGGKPPYQFSIAQNGSGGTISAQSGIYAAGGNDQVSDVVQVADANQRTQMLTLAVGAKLSLTLAVAAATPLVPNQLIAAGGTGKTTYTYSFQPRGNRSGGIIDSVTGAYTPGNNPLALDLVQVTDATHTVATADPITLTEQIASIGNASGPCLSGDFDGDGSPELYIDAAPENLGYIVDFDRVLGARVRHIGIAGGGQARHVISADVDADGRSDLIVATETSPGEKTTIYFGDGSGSLTHSLGFASASTSPGVAFANGLLYFSDASCGGDSIATVGASLTPSCFSPADFPAPLLGGMNMYGSQESLLYGAGFGLIALGEESPGPTLGIPEPAILAGATSDLQHYFGFGISPTAPALYGTVAVAACPASNCATAGLIISPPFTPTLPNPKGFEGMLALPHTSGHDLLYFWSGDTTLTTYDYSAAAKSFTPVANTLPTANFKIDCAAALDANGDGTTDLLVSGNTGGRVALWLGEGNGRFAQRPRFSLQAPPVPFDIDGEGTLDVVATTVNGALATYFSTSDHQLALADQLTLPDAVGALFAGPFGASGDNAVFLQYDNNAMAFVPFDKTGQLGAAVDISGTVEPLLGQPIVAEFGGAASGPDLLAFDSTATDNTIERIIRDTPTSLHTEKTTPPSATPIGLPTPGLAAIDLDDDGIDDPIFVFPLTNILAMKVSAALSKTGGQTWTDLSPSTNAYPNGSCVGTNLKVVTSFVGAALGSAVFLVNKFCSGAFNGQTELVVVSASGTQTRSLGLETSHAILADANTDQVADLIFRDASTNVIHVFAGPSWTTDISAVGAVAPGDVFAAIARPGTLADIVLFSAAAEQAEIVTAAAGVAYQ